MTLVLSVIDSIGQSVLANLPWTIALAVLFSVLSIVARTCNAGRPWYRKPDLLVDLAYWFVGPMIGSVILISALTIAMLALGSVNPQVAQDYVVKGYGPLAGLGFWPQVVIYLLAVDVLLYWTHRLYHTATLWRFHAIHHSSEDLEWISATRFHPGNLLLGMPFANAVMLLAGISPDVLVALAPFNLVAGALVHANLDWTYGRFGLLFASPVFHRWHHTAADRGGSKNFAATFPFLDAIFGTYYMPKGQLPDKFGVDDEQFPKDLLGQVLYPWSRRSPPVTPEQKAAE